MRQDFIINCLILGWLLVNSVNIESKDEDNIDGIVTPSEIYQCIREIDEIVSNFMIHLENEISLQNQNLEEYLLDIDDLLGDLSSFFAAETQENFILGLNLNKILVKLNIIKSYLSPIFKERNVDKLAEIFQEILFQLNEIETSLSYRKSINDISIISEDSTLKFKELEEKVNKSELLISDLRNLKVQEIYSNESANFYKFARNYEIAFYVLILFSFFYFLGLTFYVGEFNLYFITIEFPEKIHGILNYEFYIQKISFLILTTTLAAFLLKRSFMNRRLADDAYRTAKELDALPRYMEGMPDEMKEKVRFDLAYKYFGNSIHHQCYTDGENLMHENIKANTDFIKAVKDLSPKVQVPKEDKAQKDAA